MKKYKIIIFITVCLMFSFMPVFAADKVIPTPPSWVVDEEYVVFENSAAYEPELWDKICTLRKELEVKDINSRANISSFEYEYLDENDAGLNFEIGLLHYKYHVSYGKTSKLPKNYFKTAGELTEYGEKQKILYMWHVRSTLFEDFLSFDPIKEALCKFIDYPDYDVREIVVNKEMARFIDPVKKTLLETPIIAIDNSYPTLRSVPPEIINGRIMLPIRSVVDNIGGLVDWNAETKEIVITRAADTLKLTVGSSVAYKNNNEIMLDVAPYIKNGSTFLPVRFVAEQLGQNVTWAEKPQIVNISENKDASKNSNLENWVKPMGAYLIEFPRDTGMFSVKRDVRLFTGFPARKNYYGGPVRRDLAEVWNIHSREDLLLQIKLLTEYGHNSEFLEYVDFIDSLTKREYEQLLKEASEIDAYMFPLTKEIGDKWEKRGIMAWDLFRVANLSQWGYMAGYLTYNEALAAAEPAAKKLQKNFSSWEEAYDNYVDGHVWWSYTDVKDLKYEEWGRRPECKEMMEIYKEVFDNSLFKEKIISIEGINL